MKYIGLLLLVCVLGTPEAKVIPFMSQINSILKFKPVEQNQLTEKTPAFCSGLQCPQYKVIQKTKDYELREYEGTQWVSTNAKGISWTMSSYTLFMRLFKYISGANVKKEKVAMTVPVLTRIIPGQGPACEDDYTMSFFVDPKQSPAPKPSDKTVFLNKLPKQRVYVRTFGGYAMVSFAPWQKQAVKLAKAIGDKNKYHTDHYYTAGYDRPTKIFNRHNEIWFIAK